MKMEGKEAAAAWGGDHPMVHKQLRWDEIPSVGWSCYRGFW